MKHSSFHTECAGYYSFEINSHLSVEIIRSSGSKSHYNVFSVDPQNKVGTRVQLLSDIRGYRFAEVAAIQEIKKLGGTWVLPS